MKSCIYEGTIFHKRFKPNVHTFQYRMDYLFLELSEIESVFSQSSFWSAERFNLISFKRQDYLPGALSLTEQVKKTIKDLGGETFNGSAYLLTTPRRLGHCMNPISLFYCYHAEQGGPRELKYVLAEVHNTPWDERHAYLLEGPEFLNPIQKNFHVSPFMPMDTTYEWAISDPNDRMNVSIEVNQHSKPLFTASMSMVKQPMNADTLSRSTRRLVGQAFLTISAIYFQAVALWLKKIPFYGHPDKIKRQEHSE